MMKSIKSVWILEKEGNPLFTHEIAQGSEEYELALFSGLITAIQSLSQELGEKKVESMEFGNSKFFLAKNKETNTIFILRSDPNSKNKRMLTILDEIQKVFLKKFKKYLTSPKSIRKHIINAFKKDLEKILEAGAKQRISHFINNLS